MVWYIYDNSDEATQIFFGYVIIALILILIGANLYFWIKEKLK
jgi:hypothetical protein